MSHKLIPLNDPAEGVEEILRYDRDELLEGKPMAIVTVHGETTALDVNREEYQNDELLRRFITDLRACLEPTHHKWLRNKGWSDADIVALDELCECPDTVKAVKKYQKATVEKK